MYRFTIVVCVAVLVFLPGASLADIPQLINYQGMLTGDTGEPLDGTFDMFFRIYNAESGGDKRWEENHAALSVSQGLFNVILGSQSGGIDLDFSEEYWLEVEVEGEVMPRIEFTSVGYAYRALVADSALSATPGSGSNWSVDNSVIHTNQYWGIVRGNAGNLLYGDSARTMVNLGVACTTGADGENNFYSTVGGGYANRANGNWATVGGGWINTADGAASVIGGGVYNRASGTWSCVGGGDYNFATGYGASVCGGVTNNARGDFSFVGGGGGIYMLDSNSAIGNCSVVPGGTQNVAGGDYSFAAGRRAKALHHGSFVWADSTDADFASTGPNQLLIRASGGVGIGTTSPGQRLDVDLGDIIVQGTGSFDANGEEGTVYLGSVHHYIKGVYGFGVKIGTYVAGDVVSIEEISGSVGIGTDSPGSFRLAVNGDAAKSEGGTSWAVFSDARLKEIGEAYEYGLSEIGRLKPVRYHYKQDNELGLQSKQDQVGLVAQDVQDVIPDAVSENDQGYLMLNSDPIIWAMLNAIKELEAENEELKLRIEGLEQK